VNVLNRRGERKHGTAEYQAVGVEPGHRTTRRAALMLERRYG
jgi:hypothetical protein